MRRRRLALLLAAACAGACNKTITFEPAPSPTTTTETFASALGVQGASSRVFTVANAGTIIVTLTSVGPPTVPVGLGLGIPGGGVTCSLTVSLNSTGGSSPQISVPADVGSYCVQVYDLGNIDRPLPFSLTIQHP